MITTNMKQIDAHTVEYKAIIKPAMCGHNASFVAHIGDWTWDTVSCLCKVDVLRARDAENNPTYLSFYFYHIRGDQHFHHRTPTFGDYLQIVSTCYDCGSESVLTLHRITHAYRHLPTQLSIEELHKNRYDGCLYVQNFNRWVRRGSHGNTVLHTASPRGFSTTHLRKVPPELSPRTMFDHSRRQGYFDFYRKCQQPIRKWLWYYKVDMARDLNGVNLLYFASYFAIIDSMLAKAWHQMKRSDHSFLNRIEIDKRLCFLANADPNTQLMIKIQQSFFSQDSSKECFDVQISEKNTHRLLAISGFTSKVPVHG